MSPDEAARVWDRGVADYHHKLGQLLYTVRDVHRNITDPRIAQAERALLQGYRILLQVENDLVKKAGV